MAAACHEVLPSFKVKTRADIKNQYVASAFLGVVVSPALLKMHFLPQTFALLVLLTGAIAAPVAEPQGSYASYGGMSPLIVEL